MKQIGIWLCVMLLLALSLPVFAADVAYLQPAELKALIERPEPGLVMIDVRARSQYDAAHIAGAISIPLAELEKNPGLPEVPKESALVFYCSGTTWRGSADAARVAVQRGFTHVSVLKGGLPAWQSAGYPVELAVKKEQ